MKNLELEVLERAYIKMKNWMRKKRGATSVSILLLVVMALVLCITAIFIFLTGNKGIEEEILNAKIVDKLYVQEQLIDFYLIHIAKDVFKETYESRDILDEAFKEQFKDNFKNKVQNYEFDDEFLIDLKEKISAEKFEISVDGQKLNLRLKDLELVEIREGIEISYKPDFSLTLYASDFD